MIFEYTLLFVISEFLSIEDLQSFARVDRVTGKAVPEYVKLNRVINCGRNKEKALKLAGQGYRVKLDLESCKNITDLSALGGVHTLYLTGCKNITDVSALGGVHTLDLSYCDITDVSALGGVRDLKFVRRKLF